MASPVLRAPTIRFGLFELDAANRELRKRGHPVRLQPRQFDVLHMLVEHAGQVVSREEIRERIWAPDTFVDFERSINFAINQIRAALKDDAERPRFIETLPKRGYRFIAVIEIDHRTEDISPPAPIPINRPAVAFEHVEAMRLAAPLDGAIPAPLSQPSVPTEAPLGASALPRAEPAPGHPLKIWISTSALLFLSLLVASVLWMHLRPSHPAEIRERQLTRNSTDNPIFSAAISGDGKYLAFADAEGLHVKLVQTGEIRDIPEPPEYGKSAVHWRTLWFPDSARFLAVAYHDGERLSTWQASVVGGTLRLLRKDAIAWSISPDGSLLAFTTAEENEAWLMDATGENARKIFDAGQHNWFTNLQWSPEGEHLLMIKHAPKGGSVQRSMEIRDMRSGATATLLSDTKLRSLTWLKDERILYVLAEDAPNSDSCNYWAARLDSEARKFAAPPKQMTHGSGFCLWSTSATADSKQLVFLKKKSDYSVYVADLSAGATRMTPPRHLTLTEGKEFPAAWTADSREVVFVSDRDGKWGFYRQPLDGKAARPILRGIVSDGLGAIFPRLSPEGKLLVYAPYPPDYIPGAARELLSVPITGGKPHVVLKAPMSDTPRCAQAPARLCAVSNVDQGQMIFTGFDPLRGIGNELARLKIDDPDKFYGWALSPDGSMIAVSKRSTAEIQVLSLRTHTVRKITVKGWNNLMSLDWISDGTGLFTSTLQPSGVLLRVDLQGNAQVLWEPKGAAMTWAMPSPDGKHVAMPAFSENSNIWTLENL